jgi:Heavy metal associated domain 2
MVGVLGEVLLELAAAHLLPALVAEAGGLALRRAARSLAPGGAPGLGGTGRRPVRGPAPAGWPGVRERPGRPTLRLVPAASVVSHVPGRVRFRVAGLHGDEQWAEALATRLRAVAGVLGMTVSPLTGTVLVHYDARRATLDVLQQALGASRPETVATVTPAGLGRAASRVPRLRLVED